MKIATLITSYLLYTWGAQRVMKIPARHRGYSAKELTNKATATYHILWSLLNIFRYSKLGARKQMVLPPTRPVMAITTPSD